MSKWTKQKLGNICDLQQGLCINRKSKHLLISVSDLPLLRIRDLIENKEEQYINPLVVPKQFISDENSLIYTRTGQVGLVFKNRKGVVHNNCFKITPKNSIDINYLFYLLKQKNFYNKVIQIASKAAQPDLTHSAFKSIEVIIPSNLQLQRNIVSVISAYDDLIEINEKRIKILEEMAQRLYTEWFVKFKFPGHEKVKMVDSGTEYGMIPEGWEVYPLRELITTQYGYTAPANNDSNFPKYLRGTDINKNSFIDWSKVPNCTIDKADFLKYQVHRGDVFIIRMADPGKIGICEININAVFASYLIRLKIKSKLLPYYLYYFVTSDKYQNFITGASSGTTRKSINSQQVGSTNVLIPDKETLTLFEEKVGVMRSELTNLVVLNDNLTKMRDLLIPQLVKGKRELKNV